MTNSSVTHLEDTYVKAEERLLDPSKIPDSLLERMPAPTGWRMLILPYRGKGTTEGGIMLTDSTLDEDQVQTVVGYVLKPVSYTHLRAHET